MSDTPLYDATLADQLLRARHEGEVARARWTLAERAAGERAAEAERVARLRIAEAERVARLRIAAAELRAAELERRLVLAERQARLRLALVAQVPERVIDLDEPAPLEQDAPPVPSMQELLRPSPGVTRFLDALLGPTDG